MEDVVELRLAGVQIVQHLVAGLDAQVGGNHVEEMGVADLVLRLCQRSEFPFHAGGPRNEVTFGQSTHQLRVGMHLDEAENVASVIERHLVARFDDSAIVEEGLELLHRLPAAHEPPITNDRSLA